MKRFLFTIVLFLICSQIFSQEPFKKYYNIVSITGVPSIRTESIDDLIALANKAKVDTVFITSKDLIVNIEGVYYFFDLNGYQSVGDFRIGTKQEFLKGADYYKAKTLSINESEIYYYYIKNTFASLEDCRLAFKNGFQFEKYDYANILLPIKLSSIEIIKLVEIFPWLANNSKTGNPLLKKYLITQDSANAINEIDTLFSLDKEGQTYNSKNTVTETQLFYLAKLLKINSYKEYQNLYNLRLNGYYTQQDMDDAVKNGFTNSWYYYKAQKSGFNTFEEFTDATEKMRVSTYSEYIKYLAVINQVTKIATENKISISDAIVSYYISILARGKSYSIQSLVLTLMKEIDNARKPIEYYLKEPISVLSEEKLRKLFLLPSFTSLGTYEKEGDVFTKK